MKKLILPLFLMLCISARAQHVVKNTFQTPEVASLISEVQTPVSLSSGGLGIEIPVYTLKEGDITVPISLSYDATGVRVASHPGWVGQNWTLKAGGMISRVVKSVPDESRFAVEVYFPNYGGNNRQTFEHFPGFYYNYNRLNTTSWNSTTQITNWAKANDNYELESDEYIFNFCGHSGKFYMTPQGTFEVVGQKGYKIEPFTLYNIPLYDGRKPLHYQSGGRIYINDDAYTYQDGNDKQYVYLRECRIVGFKMTDPQGFVYYFGAYEKAAKGQINVYEDNFDGIEITSSFFAQLYNESYSTFYLMKIESPRKYKVEFNYENGRLATFSTSYTMNNMKVKDQASFWNLWSPGYMQISSEGQSMDGSLVRTQYLKSITTGNTVIDFKRSDANSLDYNYSTVQTFLDKTARETYSPTIQTIYFYGIWPVAQPKILYNQNGQKVIAKTFNPGLLDWEKLDEITVRWKGNTGHTFKYRFTYRDTPGDRLQLTSLMQTRDTLTGPAYRFSYNNSKKLPTYLDQRTDHWGYYNGTTPSVTNKANYINYKSATPAYTDSEILTKITYPTGGSREFIYEPNKYTKVVRRDKNTGNLSLVTVSETSGGGLRIREVIDRTNASTVAQRKTYTYTGGILNGETQYYWPDYKGKLFNGNTYTAERFFSYSILPVSENPAGGAVSYSKVTETLSGNGRTEYSYSNHDTRPDENAVSIDPEKSAYSPLTSRVAERGLLLKKEVFAQGVNTPLQRTTYTYTTNNTSQYIPLVQVRRFTYFNGTSVNAIEGSAYKIYTSPMLLQSETVDLYNSNSTVAYFNRNNYAYNPLYQLKEKVEYGSEHGYNAFTKLNTTTYNYVYDVYQSNPENVVYKRMADSNILTPLVSQSFQAGNQRVKDIRNDYSWSNKGIPYVYKVYVSENGSPFRVVTTCMSVDKHGNPTEILRDGISTSYLWGYDYQYFLTEVKNATYSSVVSSIGGTVPVENICSALSPDMVQVDSLRTKLPQSLVTTYTYIPLVGIGKEVSPDGSYFRYSYDFLGRLISVRDKKRAGIVRHIYHYGIN